MKRSLLGSYLTSVLRSPDAAEGAGGLTASMTGDAALDSEVMGRLNLQMEDAPVGKSTVPSPQSKVAEPPKSGTNETAEQKAEREAAAAEETRLAGLVESTGKTKEEILAEEAAAAETATQERQDKIAELVAAGKTPEEAEAEVDAVGALQTPELTPEVQTWVDEQLAAKDTEITTLTEQAETAQRRVEELEASATGQPVAIAAIDPLFLIDDPAVLEAEAGKLRSFEAWLLKNWDGTAATEASADGKTKASPGYTSEQIRERYAQVKELRETILPAAKEGIQLRKAHEAQARKVYPALFDAKTPEYRVAQNLLKQAPALKAVIPNIHIVIGDALRGEKLRVAEEKARAKGKPVAGKTIPPKVVKPAPAAGARPVATAAKKPAEVVNTDKFSKLMEGGASGREALIAALG